MSMPREPLSPEERALAGFLARAPGQDGPGPALDARILAAAQAAIDAADAGAPSVEPVPTARPIASPALPSPRATGQVRPRSTRRWSLGLGVAASLMIAVTITWQLRPQASTQRVYESAQAPVADASPPISAQDRVAPGAASAPPAPEAPDVPARPALMASPPDVGTRAPTPSPSAGLRKQAPRVQQVAPPPDLPAAEPSQLQRVQTYTLPASPAAPAEVHAPAPPAPAAPAATTQPNAPQSRAAAAATAQSVSSRRALAQEDAPAAAEQLRTAQESTSANPASPAVAPPMTTPRADRGPTAIVPSAIAEDRQLPPAQWLQHIRKYRFEGDSALARASLQAFQQAHPDLAIPQDLRPLLP